MADGRFQKGSRPANARDWTDIDAAIRDRYPAEGSSLAACLGLSKNSLLIRASKIGVRCEKRVPASARQKEVASSLMRGRGKSTQTRERLSASLKGRKHSPERVQAIVEGMRRGRKRPRGMTKPEIRVEEILRVHFGPTCGMRFRGDRGFWLQMPGGKWRNPDFVDELTKRIIEVFGRYWHRGEDAAAVEAQYREIGWDCLVVWDDAFDVDAILYHVDPFEYMAAVEEPSFLRSRG